MNYSDMVRSTLPEKYGEPHIHPRKIFSAQQREEAVMQVHRGADRTKVQDAFGITDKTLAKWSRHISKPFVNERLWDEDIKKDVLDRINDGESLYAVAKETWLCTQTVWKWAQSDLQCQQRVEKIISKKGHRSRFPQEFIDAAVQQVRNGVSRKIIAKETNVTPKTIQIWCEKTGLPRQFRASDQMRAAAVQRVLDGESSRMVAFELKVLESTVIHWCKNPLQKNKIK